MVNVRLFVVSLFAVAVIATLSKVASASSIAQAELSASGTALTLDQNPVVSAVLTVPGPTNGFTQSTQRYIFLVDDGTASMDVFAPSPLVGGYVPAIGDQLTISGPFSPFNGIPEMGAPTAITVNSSGKPTPAPLLETIPAMASYTTQPPTGTAYPSFAGHLVTLDNVSVSSATTGNYGTSNVSLTITDSSSNTMTAFYNPTTYSLPNQNLFGSPIARSGVNVTGLVQLFNSAPELLVMSIAPVPEPSTLVLGSISLIGVLAAWKKRTKSVNAAKAQSLAGG
jgi:hypothetical protein